MVKSSRTVLIVILGSALGLSGLAFYASKGDANKIPAQERRQSFGEPSVEVQVKPKTSLGKVEVFNATYKGDDLVFSSTELSVPKDESPIVFSLNEYLDTLEFVDKKARVVGAVLSEESGEVKISCTQGMRQTYGTEDESTLFNGIRVVLGQFPQIKTFKLLIEGQPIETFGSVDLTEPITVAHIDSTGRIAKQSEESEKPASR